MTRANVVFTLTHFSVTFHIEPSHLISQSNGFDMQCKTELKWVGTSNQQIKIFLTKKTLWPLLRDGAQLLQGYRATTMGQLTVYHLVPRNWPRKDERFSLTWACPMVSNLGFLLWESSALTTRSLLHNIRYKHLHEWTYLLPTTQNIKLQSPIYHPVKHLRSSFFARIFKN